MRLSPIALQCAQVTAICVALLTGVILSEMTKPVRTNYLGRPCEPCELDIDLRGRMASALRYSSVIIAQEVDATCCAMVGYDDNEVVHWCSSPRLLAKSSPYNTLQNFHCGDHQRFTVFGWVQFQCEDKIIEIWNPALAGAYTVAFALMDGFNCS
jgi:hypothetical protein